MSLTGKRPPVSGGRFSGHGQSAVEMVGTMVISAVIIALVWAGGRSGMSLVFDSASDRQMDFFAGEIAEGYSDSDEEYAGEASDVLDVAGDNTGSGTEVMGSSGDSPDDASVQVVITVSGGNNGNGNGGGKKK